MKILTWPKRRWQYLLDVELIIILAFNLLAGIAHKLQLFFVAAIMLLVLVLNCYRRQQKYLK